MSLLFHVVDSLSAYFSFLKSDLDACVGSLSQMIREPAFEKEKIELALSLKNEELRRIEDNPQRLAFREFNRLLYPGDPRGRYATPTSIKKITRDDLIAFRHRAYYFPANLMLAVSGDLSREEAIHIIQKHFGNWTNSREACHVAPPPKQDAQGVFFIRKPLPQSTVVSGEFTLSKNDPDYYAFSVRCCR